MKRVLSIMLVLLLTLSLAACGQPAAEPSTQSASEPQSESQTVDSPPAEDGVADGTYEGTAQGFGGELKVSVDVQNGTIGNISVTEHSETPGVSDLIIENMPARIIEAQSYEVDLISGATYTANAIKYAVKQALETAGAADGMFDSVPQHETKDEERTADVVVVGAGLAGLSAAIEAKEAGADVILLEKLGRIGGNSIVAGGIVYATNSPLNGEYDNDPEDMVSYYQSRANGKADETLLRYAAENSGDTVAWLMELGVEFLPDVGTGGLSPALRAHTNPNRGAGIVLPVYQKALDAGVEILMETPVTELIADESGAVIGVVAQGPNGKVTVNAKAIIIAAGGFDGDEAMRDQYAPHAKGTVIYSSPGNAGDYIAMGESVGAAMHFPDAVMGMRIIHKNAYLTDGVNILAWLNTIAVTDEGVRFENESDDYPVNFTNMMETGRELFYWIYDASTAELCELAIAQGYGFKGETIEELATAAGMDPDTLAASIARYNELGEAGVDEDFGKEGIVPLSQEGPYYAIQVRPACIAGFGGFMINTDSQVLNTQGEAIAGLYAAGECASGQFFDREYPASGTMLNFSTVFGRTAGRNAAQYAG